MSITVLAHFCQGSPSPFPKALEDLGIPSEGSLIPHPLGGGVIVVSYDTPHGELVREAFEAHLAEHDLTVLALQRRGETEFFYHRTHASIF